MKRLTQKQIITSLDTGLELWEERPDLTGLWRPIRLLQWYEPQKVRDELCNLFHHRLGLRLVGNTRKAIPDLVQEEPYRQLLEDWARFPDVDRSGMKNPDTFQTQVIMRQGTGNLERYVQQRDTILRELIPFSEKDKTVLQSILRRRVAKLFIRVLEPKASEADVNVRRQFLLWEDLNTCFDYGANRYPLYFLPADGADVRIIAPWTLTEASPAAYYFYAANIIGKIYTCGDPIDHGTLLASFHEKLNQRILAIMSRDECSQEDYDLLGAAVPVPADAESEALEHLGVGAVPYTASEVLAGGGIWAGVVSRQPLSQPDAFAGVQGQNSKISFCFIHK